MPKIFTKKTFVITGGGEPGDCPPTAVFADTFALADTPALRVQLPDSFGLGDFLALVRAGLIDTVGIADALNATVDTTSVENVQYNDLLHPKGTLPDSLALGDYLSITSAKLIETFGVADFLSYVMATIPETLGCDDRIRPITTLFDTLGIADFLSLAKYMAADTVGLAEERLAAKIGMPETLGSADRLSLANAADVVYGRSATPDTDDAGDAWTDATALQGDVNHGNEALQVSNVLANVKTGWIKIRLRDRIVGFTGKTGGGRLDFTAQEGAAVGDHDLTFGFDMRGATNPFTESTLTENNKPAHTNEFTAAVTVVGAVDAAYAITWSIANVSLMVNQWVQIRITTAAATAVCTIRSREAAVASRWALTLFLEI